MTPLEYVEFLASLEIKDTFNPYADRCSLYDFHDAPIKRKTALLTILQAAYETEIDAVWIGRDLGYRGGRRTGLALTDESQMQAHAKRWGIRIARHTKGNIVSERTATVIWDVLSKIETNIFLWNVFPLHPHEKNNPFSNRAHNAHERAIGEDLLDALINMLKPRRVIAIGNDAGKSARKLCLKLKLVQVRHPSYGGQSQFLSEMYDLYSLVKADMYQQSL